MSTRTRTPKHHRRPTVGMSVAHALAWVYALLLVVPLYYLVVSAFKANQGIFATPLLPTFSEGVANFLAAWENAALGKALLNSVYVTLGAEVVTLLLALPASYAIARARGRVGTWLERVFGLGLLVPTFAALVPAVMLAVMFGLFHNKTFLVLFYPATALPVSVILLTQFIRAIPLELEESAAMDGASRWAVMLRIILPLAGPGIVTIFILNFLNFWNEYLFALVIAGPEESQRTAQVAVPALVSLHVTQYGVVSAGTVISMIPMYAVFVLLRRRMETAMLAGAVKM